jgi:hypothetical protein
MEKTYLCNLQSPANCEFRKFRLGEKFSPMLCGNNPLSDSFKQCPYKADAGMNRRYFETIQSIKK